MATPRLNPGDVIILNNWNGNFLSKAIRFFTKSWSHTAFGFFDLPRPAQTVFEANLLVGITDWKQEFDDPDYDLRVYQWTTPPDNIQKIMWTLYDKYNANTYGFFQLLWFMWRWMVEGLHLPSRWARKNFFPNNEVCTEVVYMGFTLLDNPVVNDILARLNRDQNTVHPGDIIWICEELVKQGMMKQIYNRQR